MLDWFVLKLIDRNSYKTCTKLGTILSVAQLAVAWSGIVYLFSLWSLFTDFFLFLYLSLSYLFIYLFFSGIYFYVSFLLVQGSSGLLSQSNRAKTIEDYILQVRIPISNQVFIKIGLFFAYLHCHLFILPSTIQYQGRQWSWSGIKKNLHLTLVQLYGCSW